MGIVDVVSELCSLPRSRRHIKTVEMAVRIDDEGFERKVKEALKDMEGVRSVHVSAPQHKVTVTGYVDAGKVMQLVASKTGKRVEPWPYMPYETVAHPYASGAYNYKKKAPPGYVRNLVANPIAAAASPPPPQSFPPPPQWHRPSYYPIPRFPRPYPYPHYVVHSAEEDPNTCSIM